MSSIINSVISSTWPMILVSVVVASSLRIAYLIRNNLHFTLYKELFTLIAIIYVLELFQIVTSGDVVSWSTNNIVPFKEIFRYKIGSRLFLKNVLGNILLFMPYGFFAAFYLKEDHPKLIVFLTLVISLTIELVQMSIGRVFDVDDIILNTIGGFLGFNFYLFFKNISDIVPSFFKNEIFLNTITAIFLLGLLSLI